ncbi:cytochrome P450 [Streptomyces prunicolor]|uniref:cytochrome P450 n=1 Tax=Streptomyces prunicolor TaxID=67348 RepID=UPI00224C9153|nr:cytochrome P450 [Streptomyces prunicolor]MCX5243353.1 cytochrome P450 [Streptomyces prunicolor]
MNTPPGSHSSIELPSFPGLRSSVCPFDPPAEYTRWRLDTGLPRVLTSHGRTAWAVTRYEDARLALGDPRISADVRRYPVMAPSAQDAEMPPAFPRQDDPDHARTRRMLTGEFTVKRMEAMRPQLRGLIDRVLEEMTAEGRQPTDLVRAYALPVPSLAISLLLGVPYENHAFFQEHAATLARLDAKEDERTAARRELFDFIVALVKHKEREPGDDLISRLLVERVATGELSHEEVAMIAQILLHAGHETTANMIGLGSLALLCDPHQAARIRDSDDPGVVAGAVEELLRYLTIAQDMVWRVAVEDLTIGGQLVRAGDLLTISLPAANRDGFFRNPDDLDIGRNARGHLAFGHGIHQCLGQSLARVELQEAFPALLRALPDLRLAVPLEDVEFRHDMATFGVHELPVRW